MKLNDQTAVIIGGTGDIGHATARLFIEAGANVVITGRSQTQAGTRASVLGGQARSLPLPTLILLGLFLTRMAACTSAE
jgi:NAD(P)-dependent dehydrogenase (short-subunit alcohol dehydrogenase family)